MAQKGKKFELRQDLIDAGIVHVHTRPIGAFVYAQRDINLETVSVRKALQIAKDPNNKILEYQEPKKASGSTNKGSSK